MELSLFRDVFDASEEVFVSEPLFDIHRLDAIRWRVIWRDYCNHVLIYSQNSDREIWATMFEKYNSRNRFTIAKMEPK